MKRPWARTFIENLGTRYPVETDRLVSEFAEAVSEQVKAMIAQGDFDGRIDHVARARIPSDDRHKALIREVMAERAHDTRAARAFWKDPVTRKTEHLIDTVMKDFGFKDRMETPAKPAAPFVYDVQRGPGEVFTHAWNSSAGGVLGVAGRFLAAAEAPRNYCVTGTTAERCACGVYAFVKP